MSLAKMFSFNKKEKKGHLLYKKISVFEWRVL